MLNHCTLGSYIELDLDQKPNIIVVWLGFFFFVFNNTIILNFGSILVGTFTKLIYKMCAIIDNCSTLVRLRQLCALKDVIVIDSNDKKTQLDKKF